MSSFSKPLDPDSVRVTQYASGKAPYGAAPLRLGFVVDDEGKGEPPMTRMLRGGQGGSVRLKLYLTLLWQAPVKPPHQVTARAASFAQLLQLDDPLVSGARRINDAMGWLSREGFVSIDRRPGDAPVIQLLDERGTRRRYQHPKDEGKYIQIPTSFWSRRWIHDMSGAAVALLLIILAELHLHGPRVFTWISPSNARKKYGLSKDTWTKGTKELGSLGLIVVKPRLLAEHDFATPKRRNEYRLRADAGTPGELHADFKDVRDALTATLHQRPLP